MKAVTGQSELRTSDCSEVGRFLHEYLPDLGDREIAIRRKETGEYVVEMSCGSEPPI